MSFPSQLSLVVAYSGQRAFKSQLARNAFNQRVACYQLAEMLMRQTWPPAASMQHLRDLTPERLNLGADEMYRVLARLPQSATRNELRKMLPDHADQLDRILSTHQHRGGYDLRGVTLFGLSEIVRAEQYSRLLSSGDLDALGRSMRASHDGDRVTVHRNGKVIAWKPRLDPRTLEDLASRQADLATQCGRYACSTEAVDALVDIACGVDGVVGAQLAGAGLGGSMMILARRGATDELIDRLGREFYQPRGLEFAAQVMTPVAGAGVLSL